MKKIVCDRCGKEIFVNRKHIQIVELLYYKQYDLCGDCMKEFREFMKEKEDSR